MRFAPLIVVAVGHLVVAGGVFWTIHVMRDGFTCWGIGTGLVVLIGVSLVANGLKAISERLLQLWWGSAFAFGFGYWTVYLLQDEFTCWSLLTGLFAAGGILNLWNYLSQQPYRTGRKPDLPDLDPETPFDGKTAFDDLRGSGVSWTVDRPYESFVSYRSVDAEVVRLVAEQRNASGELASFRVG
jgi:hypothetical protein